MVSPLPARRTSGKDNIKKEKIPVHDDTRKQGSTLERLWYGFLVIFLLTSTGQALAQPSRQGWTLRQCLERALESSPDVHETRADLPIAESQLAQAKSGRLPQINLTMFTGLVNGVEGEGFDARVDNSKLGPFLRGNLEVIQPLYTFGRLRNEIRAAMQGVASKHAATEKARDAVIAAVKELYYNLLFSRQIKDLLSESQANFAKALDTAEQRFEADEANVTQEDILRLRIGLAGVSKEIFTLERAIAVSREALRRQLGLPPESAFDIVETRLTPVELRLQPLASYLEQVDQLRPEIAQLEAGLEAQKARLQAARSAYYPTIFVAGAVAGAVAPVRQRERSPFVTDNFNFFDAGAALGLRWQLDFWMTRAKVAERQAEVAKVEVQKENAETGIDLDLRRRYLEVQENQHKLAPAQTAHKAARALMLTGLANFTLGIGEGADVFRFVGLYTQMASDYYTVIRDLNIAAARLSQAAGQEVTTLSYQR
jgi:outer membrane protein